ncbi:B3 domain-containing protein Os01g0234100-like isoform X2 [Diospyros lotus]|nr:B3 domain-containing protein Os01g0234100-like isoform X2 [Diospyros lotus]
MERAKEVQENLGVEFPSFVKSMLRSHVAGGFWLGLPKRFCDLNLPKHVETIILVDERGKEYRTKYLADKTGLSAGWRGFSIAHELAEGDVIVFQLVQACKFKVYILRANAFTEVDGATGLLNVDAQIKTTDADQDQNLEVHDNEGKESIDQVSLEFHHDNAQEHSAMILDASAEPATDQSVNESEGSGSKLLAGIRFAESVVDFKDIKSIDDFTIVADGLVIDSEIPRQVWTKYYELCRHKKSFLHGRLLQGLNCRLIAGIISETVNIADAIKASKITTSRRHFTTWDKTLKAFEDMGMDVGFLRARLDRLLSLVIEQEVLEAKKLERSQVEAEMRTLEVKLCNLEEEIEDIQANCSKLEVILMEEANAPW